MNERKPIVFYHANCTDGFAGAYVFWSKHGGSYDYHALDYKDNVPVELIENRQTVFVDICLNEASMRTVAALSEHPCLVLDHHVGMQDTFRKLEEDNVIYGKFDLNFSGAGLAWNWCYPGDDVPWLIAAVEDRDLWKFNLAHTKAVLAYVNTFDFDFKRWDEFRYAAEQTDLRENMAQRGNAILRYQEKLIRNACNHKLLHKTIGGIARIPTLNLDYSMASDAGNLLAERAPFAAIYNDEPAGRRYSLRSRKIGGEDVCAIAKRYGGGGHKNAAGFLIPWNRIADIENEFQEDEQQDGLGQK